MKTFEALKLRLKQDLGIDADGFERLRPGHWQRKAGAWSWFAKAVKNPSVSVGSQFSASELLKANKIVEYTNPDNKLDIDVIPEK